MASWFSRRPHRELARGVLALGLHVSACSDPEEAPRVELPVVVDGSCLTPVTTDLGYTVQVHGLRMAARDLQFAVAGEVHMTSREGLRSLLFPSARAHPGHYTGGEVTGELTSRFVLDWINGNGAELGMGTLLQGLYDSANLTLDHADATEVSADDPLLGHSAYIAGTASKDGGEVHFVAVIDSPDARQIVGFPFDLRVNADTRARLGLTLCTVDPLEQDTLFDGLDFSTLSAASEGTWAGQVVLNEASTEENLAAYQRLKRTLQTHDHFALRPL